MSLTLMNDASTGHARPDASTSRPRTGARSAPTSAGSWPPPGDLAGEGRGSSPVSPKVPIWPAGMGLPRCCWFRAALGSAVRGTVRLVGPSSGQLSPWAVGESWKSHRRVPRLSGPSGVQSLAPVKSSTASPECSRSAGSPLTASMRSPWWTCQIGLLLRGTRRQTRSGPRSMRKWSRLRYCLSSVPNASVCKACWWARPTVRPSSRPSRRRRSSGKPSRIADPLRNSQNGGSAPTSAAVSSGVGSMRASGLASRCAAACGVAAACCLIEAASPADCSKRSFK
mmetsp:Transcript_14190/g.40361  ORF Transcript_14190/g.40361 Transcript_14190/m.40361 type:complete len:283 (-) Transcript_14190:466-1314(-)